ncbi:tandem-95 repeat protein [Bacteriovorax sp. Seq25_V]|uniref:tandem-95 repeat protein n=1 Tax=Bacteriovorax sp. Seq25_V TaxID=1201288 RepID=UPI0009FF5A2C|nr:tandem-95 repeat protein [Bacteriovorax sp. Seq25_V]
MHQHLTTPQSFATNEDTVLNFNLATGSDIEGNTLTYTKLTNPASGTLTCTGGTSTACTYTPAANYNGSVSFTYKVNDGSLDSNVATVNITVNPINDAPTLVTPQSYATNEDTVLNFSLGAGSDIEGSTLTYTKLTDPASGTLTCAGGTSTACTYTPAANYNGSVSFTYKVNDGALDSNTATVNITVNSVNDAPTLTSPQSFATNEDTVLNFNLATGSDIEGDTLSYIKVTDPSSGTLSCTGGNSTACTYTPTANFNGSTSFTYKVNDGTADSNIATVNITINPINDIPVMASNQTFSADDNAPLNFTITNAFDIDGDSLSYKLVTTPSNGTLSNCIVTGSYGSDLTCTYQANTNYHGSDSFTYIANDGTADAASTATITINVTDKTPSAPPTVSLAHTQYRNVTGQAITVSACSDISEVLINEGSQPLAGDANWQACSTTAGAITHTLENSTEGTHTLKAWSKDSHGNVSATSNDLIVYYDVTNPTIEFDMESFIKGGSVADVKFKLTEKNASSSQSITFEYHNGTSWATTTIAASNGPLIQRPYLEQVTTPNTNGQVLQFKITFTDLAGNQTVSTANLTTDISKPTLTSLSLNSGVTTTNSGNVTSSLSASDSVSKIIKFCLKIGDNTLPADADKCWIRVDASSPGISPAQSISFSNYYILLGFAGGNYDIYAWVMDEAGNVSDNTGTINTDHFAINFIPDNPPTVSDALAVNVDVPSNPPVESEFIVASGANLYVSWIASDVEGLSATPISLKYSTDDVNFVDLPGGQNLLNASNGGCTLNGSYTGCKMVAAPTSGYFKVRVIAADNEGTTVFYNTPVLNESKLRILAGNTEHGLNGSARTAVFYRFGSAVSNAYGYKNKLVVSDDGKFFYIDPSRGLLWVNPSNGNLEVYIQKTGTSSGDGGNVTSATLKHPSAIALDHQNRLLIWDSNLVRRVNISTGIIETIIGGGAQTDPLTTVNSSDISLGGFDAYRSTLVPLPNGDIIFTAPTGSLHHRRYRASDNKIELINVTGQGVTSDSTYDWTSRSKHDLMFSYNTSSSAFEFMAQNIHKSFTGDSYPLPARIDYTAGGENSDYPAVAPYDLPFIYSVAMTGMDGKLYLIQRFRQGLRKYDPATNTMDYVIGTGSYSTTPCADGTLATSCQVDIETAFVTKTGNYYFMDNGLLRTIDGDGKVVTIFGQFSGYGDGVLATSARIANVTDIQLRQSSAPNTFVLMDNLTNKVREFEVDGNITNIASAGASWHGPYGFETDKSTGDIYIPRGSRIGKIEGGTNTETYVVGGGSSQYHLSTTDGVIGSSINLISGYNNETAGFIDGKLYYRKHSWASGSNYGCTLKAYDTTDSYRQSHVMGNSSATCSLQMTTGTNLRDLSTSGTFTKFRKIVDPNDGIEKEFFTNSGSDTIYTSLNGGPLTAFRTLPRGIGGFDYRYKDGNLEFFYCSGSKLYKYVYNTSTETQLTWSSSTITCSSSKVIYSDSRNSVVFGFHQNGLYGVAEYLLD